MPRKSFLPTEVHRTSARIAEGLSLGQIAACMGWSLRTASAMIERYAKVSPEETDEVLHILKGAKKNG